jgi:uncharacterized protein (DUF362 family)
MPFTSARRICLTAILLLAGSGTTLANTFAVGVVGSDDTALSAPVARDVELTTQQIEEMVRRAVDLVGGMESIVADTARLVALKPNITMAKLAGSGVITDPRVVRAVAVLVHEANPKARILVAEAAGGWQSPALKDCTEVEAWDQWIVDGFATGGYRDMVAELQAAGIDIDCHDMNFDPGIRLQVPGGGLARPAYDISSTIMDADVWINCPVAKTHGVKISVALKNHFGIMPGTLYGWPKRVGTTDHEGVPHMPQVVDESLIDLWALTRVDFNVVDMIRGAEAGAFFGNPKHANIVLAGRDPVAVDLTAAQLMGFNPDDLETGTLAARQGMGPGSFESVDVRGGDVDVLRSRWRKAGASYGSSGPWGQWSEQANYGMGPRYWTLLGPIASEDPAPDEAALRTTTPMPRQDGWSEITWFGHDKIDLDRLFDDPSHVIVYGFTQFHMPQADSVRFWFGSDEGLQVWIDGEQIYEHEGRRKHRLGTDRIAGYLQAGEHRLLIKATQGRGTFDFSINICEPIDDDFYAGNRYPGLKYYVSNRQGEVAGRQLQAQVNWYPWYSAESERTIEGTDPIDAARMAPDSLAVATRAAPSMDLMTVAMHAAGLERPDLDSLTLACLSQLPFGMGHFAFGMEGWPESYGPPPGRTFNWLGLDYAVDSGNSQREVAKLARGWLQLGRLPLIDNGGWGLISAYRQSGTTPGEEEFRWISADTTGWIELPKLRWSSLPGGMSGVNTIVAVARRPGDHQSASLVDSIAVVAVEMARQPLNLEPNSWGARRAWTGLAAWDRWVVDWERQPWTPSWAREEWPRDRLESMRDDLETFAERGELAAAYFSAAADRSADDRQALLTAAAGGYGEVGELMRQLLALMPESSAGEETAEDRDRLDGIGRAGPLVRMARDAQRTALMALADLVDADLPPVAADPLAEGDWVQVLHWQSGNNQGVYDLVLENGDLTQTRRAGRIAEEVQSHVADGGVDLTGTRLEVKRLSGAGIYQVWEQPSAENGWRTVIRVDDEDNWGQIPTEIEVWAVR